MNDVNRQPAGGSDPSGDRGEEPREAAPPTGALPADPSKATPERRRPAPQPGGWFDAPAGKPAGKGSTAPAQRGVPPDPDGRADGRADGEADTPATAPDDATEELPAPDEPPAGPPATTPAPPPALVAAAEPAETTPIRRVEGPGDGDGDGAWAPRRATGLDVFWGPAEAPPAAPPHGPGLPRTGPPGGGSQGGPPQPGGRGRGGIILVGALTIAALVVGLGVVGVMLLRGDGRGLGSIAGGLGGQAAQPAKIVITPANGTKKVRPDGTVRVIASGGRLTGVKVTAKGVGAVKGKLTPDGSSWESSGRMIPDTRYTVTIKSENTKGTAATTKTTFTTLTPTDKLGTSIMPLDGETVGVGMPVGVFFTDPITDKAKVEKQLQVTSSSKVEGAWRWIGDRQIRWRPKEFWPAGEKVTLRVKLAGVEAGKGVWGMSDRVIRFTVGDSHVSTVSVSKHTMSVAVNGKVVKTLPVSTGRDKYPTTNGIHTVLEKNRHKIMDSATIGIPKGDPGYYRLQVEFAVRITNTGEFVHSAPWSEGSQGSANVSHGCVNLSMENGEWFFGLARRGDVVKVTGSPRKPGETEGLLEWNRSFEAWKSGSAL
jgi:lipoprotein-anchoring transpeptidase ErfK/SrfK